MLPAPILCFLKWQSKSGKDIRQTPPKQPPRQSKKTPSYLRTVPTPAVLNGISSDMRADSTRAVTLMSEALITTLAHTCGTVGSYCKYK
jgi:hypothetical protein